MGIDQFLLIAAVAGVGVLHTIVPDHWAPITLIARQRGWSRAETARAALQAGTGHVVSTLVIAVIVWLAGVAVAASFGHVIDALASLALIALGAVIAISAWRELHAEGPGHGHAHGHGHSHSHGHEFLNLRGDEIHGPELQRIPIDDAELELSIYEAGVPPRFRLTGPYFEAASVETLRPDSSRQLFPMVHRGRFWESQDEIPEPHGFAVTVSLEQEGEFRQFTTEFVEHVHGPGHPHHHGHDDEHNHLHPDAGGDVALLTRHTHTHRHVEGPTHAHWHDHPAAETHDAAQAASQPPVHEHAHKTSFRTALLLILGSSPMIEGIPAFFAAGKYGLGLIVVMSVVFAISTIATYVGLCVLSTAGLDRLHLGPFERYGEVLSGAFIALVGVVFWIWPVF
jgi:nickel/cobalt transporter (NicO) family protein